MANPAGRLMALLLVTISLIIPPVHSAGKCTSDTIKSDSVEACQEWWAANKHCSSKKKWWAKCSSCPECPRQAIAQDKSEESKAVEEQLAKCQEDATTASQQSQHEVTALKKTQTQMEAALAKSEQGKASLESKVKELEDQLKRKTQDKSHESDAKETDVSAPVVQALDAAKSQALCEPEGTLKCGNIPKHYFSASIQACPDGLTRGRFLAISDMCHGGSSVDCSKTGTRLCSSLTGGWALRYVTNRYMFVLSKPKGIEMLGLPKGSKVMTRTQFFKPQTVGNPTTQCHVAVVAMKRVVCSPNGDGNQKCFVSKAGYCIDCQDWKPQKTDLAASSDYCPYEHGFVQPSSWNDFASICMTNAFEGEGKDRKLKEGYRCSKEVEEQAAYEIALF